MPATRQQQLSSGTLEMCFQVKTSGSDRCHHGFKSLWHFISNRLTALVPLKCPAYHTDRGTHSSVLSHTLHPIVLPPADPLDSNPDGSLAKKRQGLCFKILPSVLKTDGKRQKRDETRRDERRGRDETRDCSHQKCIWGNI